MTNHPSPRPLSIKVIAILFVLSSLTFMTGIPATSTLILGFYVSGWIAFVYHLCLIILGLVIGLGVWRLHETARRLAIADSTYFVIQNILTIIIPTTRMMYVYHLMTENGLGALKASLRFGANQLVRCMLYALVIWFLIKRKSSFVNPRQAKTVTLTEKLPSSSPWSTKVIALLFFVSTIDFLRNLQSDTIVFGLYITGAWAFVTHIAMVVVHGTIAIGLWNLKEWARRIAIVFDFYWILNTIFAIINRSTWIQSIALISGFYPDIPQSEYAVLLMIHYGLQVGTCILAIWFLIKRRSAFVKPAAASSAP